MNLKNKKFKREKTMLLSGMAVVVALVLAASAFVLIKRKNNKMNGEETVEMLKVLSDDILGYTTGWEQLASQNESLIVFDLSVFSGDMIAEYVNWAKDRYNVGLHIFVVKTNKNMPNIDVFNAGDMELLIGKPIKQELRDRWRVYDFSDIVYSGLLCEQINIEVGMFFAAFKEGGGTIYTLERKGGNLLLLHREQTWMS